MTDNNNVKIFGVFNDNGKLLTVFTDKDDAMDYLIEHCDDDEMLYITTGTIELPTIEEEEE